jgi:hypothetical protein
MHILKSKADPIAHYDDQIAEYARENRDREACQALWQTVIERAVMDIEYMERCAERDNLKHHELQKIHDIKQNPPTDFIQGSWFEEICAYLQIDAECIRKRIRSSLDHYGRDARDRQLFREHLPVRTPHIAKVM